jgi:hypothetical protein
VAGCSSKLAVQADEGPIGGDTSTAAGGQPGEGSDEGTGDATGDAMADSTTAGAAIRCDKIDLLVVLESEALEKDEYGTYSEYDQQLSDGFATLVSELYVSVGVEDFRVLLTGSMAAQLEPSCVSDETMPRPQCYDVVTDECDLQLGAGRNGFEYTVPEGSTELFDEIFGDLEMAGECMSGRWLESGQPGLATAFDCLFDYFHYQIEAFSAGWGWRRIGGVGPDTLLDAMTIAVDPDNACNAGFLRDDALLVVLLLAPSTDSVADSSSGNVATWQDALVQAKAGVEPNVVVLALAGDGDQPFALCGEAPVGELPTRTRELVDASTHGLWASACLPDYGPFFSSAAELIDTACAGFEAP